MQVFSRTEFLQSLNETKKVPSTEFVKDLFELLKDDKSKKEILDYFKTDLSKETLALVNSENLLFCSTEWDRTLGELPVCWFNMSVEDNEDMTNNEKLVQGWFYVKPKYSSTNNVSDDATDETYSDEKLINEDSCPGLVIFYTAVLLENGNLKDIDRMGEFDIDNLELF